MTADCLSSPIFRLFAHCTVGGRPFQQGNTDPVDLMDNDGAMNGLHSLVPIDIVRSLD